MGFFELIFSQFKKDDGAHFTHNLGVSFLRTGVICIVLGIICALYYQTQPESKLVPDPKSKVVYADVKCEQKTSHSTHRGRRRTTTRKYYYATFTCTDEKGDTFTVYNQPISKSDFHTYGSLSSFDALNVYDTNKFDYKFITAKTGRKALKEFHEYRPTITAVGAKTLGFILIIAGLFLTYKGVQEKKRAKGYKRSDYKPTQAETQKMKEQDDLMREFDEAYQRKYGFQDGGANSRNRR